MNLILLIPHITAGSLGLISGYIALYASKGETLHRRAGMVFVTVMLTMCTTGITISAVRGVVPWLNIPAGLITAYLVVTALTTVRPRTAWSRRIDTVAMVVALGVGLLMAKSAVDAVANGGTKYGMPAFPFFLFGTIGILGSIGDLRALRGPDLRGSPRLARHLWRMCTALLIAALSFFIGQAQVIPKPIRIMPLLAMPMLAVLVTMLYWLWRVRARRFRGPALGAAASARATESA